MVDITSCYIKRKVIPYYMFFTKKGKKKWCAFYISIEIIDDQQFSKYCTFVLFTKGFFFVWKVNSMLLFSSINLDIEKLYSKVLI
jgi:hypothetical protein